MKLLRFAKSTAVALALAGMILPGRVAWAAPPTTTVTSNPPAIAPVIRDVALAAGGVLRGSAVDAQGTPLADSVVTLRQAGRELAVTATDLEGRFSVEGVHGGIYEVEAANGLTVCRLWAPGTAPPAASEQLLVVANQDVQRGQRPFSELFTSAPFLIGVIIAAAIATPIIVHNSQNNSPPSS